MNVDYDQIVKISVFLGAFASLLTIIMFVDWVKSRKAAIKTTLTLKNIAIIFSILGSISIWLLNTKYALSFYSISWLATTAKYFDTSELTQVELKSLIFHLILITTTVFLQPS